MIKPFTDNKEHVIFASKSPKCNKLSTIKLFEIESTINYIEMVDA